MKRFLYILCMTVSLAGLQACKKDSDPEPIPEVVGKWASDRVRVSGLPAPYTAENRDYDAYDFAGVRTSFEIKADKTFAGTDRSSGTVDDFKGGWEYSGSDLSLKYDNGDEDKLTYSASTLISETIALQDSVTNPTTKRIEVVRYNLQLVYTKQ